MRSDRAGFGGGAGGVVATGSGFAVALAVGGGGGGGACGGGASPPQAAIPSVVIVRAARIFGRMSGLLPNFARSRDAREAESVCLDVLEISTRLPL
jgi:hypothetical protein